MDQMNHSGNQTTPPGRQWKRDAALLALLWTASTVLLMQFRPGYTFPPFELLDSWIYTSYQWDWQNQIADFGATYYGSRLSWIIPGAFFHSILPPVAANISYKLIVSALFAMACGAIVRRAAGMSAALLAVTLSVFAPQFIGALHADYVDTPVIVYAALTLACITTARYSRLWVAWIFIGGCCFAAMAIANLSSIGAPGLGIAVFHLLWLRWSFKRHLASFGLYLLAAATVLLVIGGLSARAGGQFYFLKPQVDMMLYFHGLKTNPWTAANWLWLYGATWLVIPTATLLWGAMGSLHSPVRGDEPRRLILALSAGLFVSFAWSVQLEFNGVGALLYYYYASYHLCFALPLLAALCWTGTESARRSAAWTWLLIVALITFNFMGKPLLGWTSLVPLHRFMRTPESLPLFAAGVLLLVGLLTTRRLLPRFIRLWCRPEILVLGLIACSTSTGFHGREISDHLRERYTLVNQTYRLIAREFPRGSFIYWVHADARNGVSLASTKLWGYRMITVNGFPQLDNIHFTERTVIVPGPVGRGEEILRVAASTLAADGNDLVSPQIIPVRGDGGQGFDLVSFSMQKHPIDPENPPRGTKPPVMLMAFLADGDSPYTTKLGSVIQDRSKGEVIDLTSGYPVFNPSSSGDHVATQYQVCASPGRNRQISILTLMPAAGKCLCTIQDQNFRQIMRVTLTKPSREVHMVSLPADSTSLRVVFESPSNSPTPLPTQIRIYELPD